MALNIYTSNRMENLAGALANVLSSPLTKPLDSEVIVVQSRGMERWLAMELAQRFGTWANCSYPFPNAMIQQLFSQVLPDIEQSAAFAPEVMSWRIIDQLPDLLQREEFAPLQHYLADDSDGLKGYQLAEKIADVFDQYTMFRPQMISNWEQGLPVAAEEQWQATLWRDLITAGSGQHRGQLTAAYYAHIASGKAVPTDLPERISLFGITYLPQYHLDVLAATAQLCEVNLFLLSPTNEYWADIRSNREQASLTPVMREFSLQGNSLLASLGRLGREFSDMVIEVEELATQQQDLYSDSGRSTLLKALQADILNLAGAESVVEKEVVAAADNSVQIHSCHSPLREIEVLHDQVLALFEQHEGLEPKDILVMTPDIEVYAPYITTVFGGEEAGELKIPYSIADRSFANTGDISTVLLKLLNLPDSRISVVELLDILEATPVSQCFALDDAELKLIRSWLDEVKVRWGIDGEDRERYGLPAYGENSITAGLQRLLLGYAMPPVGEKLFHDIHPYGAIEGGKAVTLGKFCDFTAKIELWSKKLQSSTKIEGWSVRLRELVADFIIDSKDFASEAARITDLLASLSELEQKAEFSQEVTLRVVRSWFAERTGQAGQNFGFMTGGITFCAMLPMRSIPFKVIALIGMNDGAFPRQNRPPGFDLVAMHPRRGDRSLRDEDRYLFLEAMLSARNCFYLSYLGQSIKDNSTIPPSVLVSELLDSVDHGFISADRKPIESQLIREHYLQAFNPLYFTKGGDLFSFSATNCAAQQQRQQGVVEQQPFLPTPLSEPAAEWLEVPVSRLHRFISNPAQFFLENRLGIRFPRTIEPLSEREPFAVSALEGYFLKETLLQQALQGEDLDSSFAAVRAQGLLPPGEHGKLIYADTAATVSDFAVAIQQQCAGQSQRSDIDFELSLGDFCLTGRLNNLWSQQMVRYRCAKLKAKDLLRSWIDHLILNAIGEDGNPIETRLIMLDKVAGFEPVDNAKELLLDILQHYWQGLKQPLPFFPETSLAFGKNQKWQLEQAIKVWEGNDFSLGEKNDPYYQRCFADRSPLDDNFVRTSRLLLEPLLSHLQ